MVDKAKLNPVDQTKQNMAAKAAAAEHKGTFRVGPSGIRRYNKHLNRAAKRVQHILNGQKKAAASSLANKTKTRKV